MASSAMRVTIPASSRLKSYAQRAPKLDAREEHPILPRFPVPAPDQGAEEPDGLTMDPGSRNDIAGLFGQDPPPPPPGGPSITDLGGKYGVEAFGRNAALPFAPSLDAPAGSPSLDGLYSPMPGVIPRPPPASTAADIQVPTGEELAAKFTDLPEKPAGDVRMERFLDRLRTAKSNGVDVANPDVIKAILAMEAGDVKVDVKGTEPTSTTTLHDAQAGAAKKHGALFDEQGDDLRGRRDSRNFRDEAAGINSLESGDLSDERSITEKQMRPGKVAHQEAQNQKLAQDMLKEKWEVWKIRTGASEADAAFKLKKAEAGLKAAGAGQDPRGAFKRKWDEFFGNAAPTKMGDEQRALGQMQDAVPEVIPQPIEGAAPAAMTANQRGARIWLDTIGSRQGADPAKIARARAILGIK